jgi:hypothetical protein
MILLSVLFALFLNLLLFLLLSPEVFFDEGHSVLTQAHSLEHLEDEHVRDLHRILLLSNGSHVY